MLNKRIKKIASHKIILRNLLLSYWLIVPILFYCYLLMFSFTSGASVSALIKEMPSLSLTFLLSCLSFIQAYLLYKLTTKENDGALLRRYLNFSLIQQFVTANIIGVVLLFLYRRVACSEAYQMSEKASAKSRFEVAAMSGMVGLLSLLVLGLTLAQII